MSSIARVPGSIPAAGQGATPGRSRRVWSDAARNLVLRVASAVVLLPAVLWLLERGGWWSAALISAAAAGCAAEYYLLAFKGWAPEAAAGIAVALALPLLPRLAPGRTLGAAFWLVVGLSAFCWVYHLLQGELAEAPAHAGHLLGGLFFSAGGLLALSLLRAGPDGRRWTWCLLLVTWGNDAAAYFGGRLLGRTKLAPRVSPGKTWEGLAFGLAASIGSMFLARGAFFPELAVRDCLAVGIATGVAGPLGDLCKSVLKRSYGVKDSGRLIPGHGGLLDRLDALLFNAPLLLAYATLLRPAFG